MNFDPEWRVVVSTTSPFETVQEVISKVHSYDLPMIIYDLAELPEGTLDRNQRDAGMDSMDSMDRDPRDG